MKPIFQFQCAVAKDSNRVVAPTHIVLSKIGQGAVVRFNDESVTYQTHAASSFIFDRAFTLIDQRRVCIPHNVNQNILRGDIAKILYDEYEIGIIHKQKSGGGLYKVNDILEITSASVVKNESTNMCEFGAIQVKEVDGSGAITKFGIKTRGIYNAGCLTEDCLFVGGCGAGFSAEVVFTPTHRRKIIERTVIAVDRFDDKTIIGFDMLLPYGVKDGALNIEKWELTLTSNYQGDTNYNAVAEISSDFTPKYGLIKPSANSKSTSLLISQFMDWADKKIFDLESKIKELESKNKN